MDICAFFLTISYRRSVFIAFTILFSARPVTIAWVLWQIPASFDIRFSQHSSDYRRREGRKLLNIEKTIFYVTEDFSQQVGHKYEVTFFSMFQFPRSMFIFLQHIPPKFLPISFNLNVQGNICVSKCFNLKPVSMWPSGKNSWAVGKGECGGSPCWCYIEASFLWSSFYNFQYMYVPLRQSVWTFLE